MAHGLSTGSSPWVIPAEDRRKHEATFQSLQPSSGFLSGEQAKKFFLQSKLPPVVLGQVWNLADIDRDGKMTVQEFTVAVHLIQNKLKGFELPTTLPNSLKMTSMQGSQTSNTGSGFGLSGGSSVSNGFSVASSTMTSSMQSGNSWSGMGMASNPGSTGFGASFGSSSFKGGLGTGFNSSATSIGIRNGSSSRESVSLPSTAMSGNFQTTGSYGTISSSNRLKYNQMFKANDQQKSGFLTGDRARGILIQSGLPQMTLMKIWHLADLDKDGKLNMDEFAIAMHFAEMAKQGMSLPPTVPTDLLPASYQQQRQDSQAELDTRDRAGSGASLDGGKSRSGSVTKVFTFEDKRKDNFEKGRLELERRRQELQDRLKREREERDRKEAIEEERRQRAKMEAEQKRHAELEKQRQQQLEMEREQEALRKKMIQQRLQAQIEAEKKRQQEWAERKKEELLNQKGIEEDIVNNLKARAKKLQEDLDSVNKAKSIVQQGVDHELQTRGQCQNALSLVTQSKEMRVAEMSRVQCEIREVQQSLEAVKKEEERVVSEVNRGDASHLAETHGNAMASLQDTKGNMRRLEHMVTTLEEELANNLKELDSLNSQLKDARTSVQTMTEQNARLQQLAEAKQREYAAWKQKKDEEDRQKKEADARHKREEEEARKQRDREFEAMKQERERQRKEQEMRKRIQEAKEAENRRQEAKRDQLLASKEQTVVQQLQQQPNLFAAQITKSTTVTETVQEQSLFPASQAPAPITQPAAQITKGTSVMQRLEQHSLFPASQAPAPITQPAAQITKGTSVMQRVEQMQKLSNQDQKTDLKIGGPPPRPQPRKKREPYQALYQFEPRNPDELSLEEGDSVMVDPDYKSAPPGWMYGECRGKSGLFPGNYVEKVSAAEATRAPPEPAKTTPDTTDVSGSLTVSSLAAALSIQFGTGGGSSSAPSTQSAEITTKAVAATASTNSGEGFRTMALYAYRAKKEDHLSFNKNDIILVKEQRDMWWRGELNGHEGWFPKSYVKLVGGVVKTTGDSSAVAEVSQDSAKQKVPAPPAPVDVKPAKPTALFECVAMYNYTGEEGDLSFSEGDTISVTTAEGDWWEGSCRGETGPFPANYVKKKEAKDEAPKAVSRSRPEIAVVTTAYTAVSADQLTLAAGQLLLVKRKDPSGWWEGELQARGKKRQSGYFPASHVKIKGPSDRRTSNSNPDPGVTSSSPPTDDSIYDVPSSLVQTTAGKLEQVLAMFPYTAQNPDELSFFKGSVINVMSKDGNWWKGEMNGKIGMFPSNYVQPLSDLPASTTQWTAGTYDAKLLSSLSDTEQKRQNVIYELINTEQSYMDDLSLTLEVFYNPMAECGMLSDHELSTVFVNWKELISTNMKLLKAFIVRKKMSDNGRIKMIGDILCEQLSRMSSYVRFCSCQLKACLLLQQKIESNPEFKQFEKKCAADKQASGLPLSSYLLKPLQRVCKYPLLIRELLKYTPEGHFDRSNLETALERAEELCQQVNEGVRSQENTDRLEWLQHHVNLEGIGERLIFNSSTNCLGQRKLLYSGTLWKVKSGKELRAFLFNDFLLLTRPQSSIAGSLSKKIGFDSVDSDVMLSIYRKPIVLNEVIVKHKESNSDDMVFHISHIDRTYSFKTESKTERNRWVETLEKASVDYIETERNMRQKLHRARSFHSSGGLGNLIVTLLEGVDLHAADPNGLSDPYCEVSMGSQECCTKVVPQTLNPKWNSTLTFTVKDLDQDVLCITVFDRDFFSPNDFLGRTEVSIASLLKKGNGPWNERLLLHEVSTGELLVKIELKLLNR